jgi:hypothetical protein
VQTLEFVGLPTGVTMQINDTLIVGTGPTEKQEKESA